MTKGKFEIFLFMNHPKEDQKTKNFENLVYKKINIFKFRYRNFKQS